MRSAIDRALLFDFDGTLLDSYATHYAAYERMFAQFGIFIDRDQFAKAYFPDWQSTFRAFGLAEELWKSANALWLQENAREEAPLRDACMHVVESLRPHWRLGIVSSGSRGRVLGDLQRTGLDSLMEVVVTGQDVTERKPSPEGILFALGKLAVPAARAVYVGDTPIDHETARAANVRFVGIRSDYASLDAEPMLSGLHELPNIIASL
jgi:HAD superfamily hydrolase (TIGR01509 family)